MTEYWLNRTACGTLDDMRGIIKALLAENRGEHSQRNFMALMSCVEELQYAFNRMEAAIGDLSQMNQMQQDRSKLKQEINKLKQQKMSLKKK